MAGWRRATAAPSWRARTAQDGRQRPRAQQERRLRGGRHGGRGGDAAAALHAAAGPAQPGRAARAARVGRRGVRPGHPHGGLHSWHGDGRSRDHGWSVPNARALRPGMPRGVCHAPVTRAARASHAAQPWRATPRPRWTRSPSRARCTRWSRASWWAALPVSGAPRAPVAGVQRVQAGSTRLHAAVCRHAHFVRPRCAQAPWRCPPWRCSRCCAWRCAPCCWARRCTAPSRGRPGTA